MEPKTSTLSFFKVLIEDYTSRLSLPHAFVQRYGEFLPKRAKLRTGSGQTWNVKLEGTDAGKCCFTEGWNKFVKDLELKLGEFVVFESNVGSSTFDVTVYGHHCCEREFPANDLPPADSDADEDFDLNNDWHNIPGVKKEESRPPTVKIEAASSDDETKPDSSPNPRFEIVLKKYHESRVVVHKHFAVSSGLIGKKTVDLVYPGGRNARVLLHLRSTKSHFKLDLAAGWPEFRKANRLRFGKHYSFEFIPSRQVIVVKQI